MKVLSLFDGISCGMLALQRAGIPVECYDAFEIDKYAVTVSKRNFPVIVHHGNVYDGDFTKFQGYNANNLSVIGIYPAKKSNRIFWTKHLALMRKFRTRSRPTFNHRNRLFQA